jgi:diguanylate cyclase (GGDEF)-like protein/PAS domain S-box-containing protein
MKDQPNTKQVLIQELASLRHRIEELERSESEWKKEKEELKKSEFRFRSYLDLSLHGVAITSPEKGWIQVNDHICSIMGYSRDEIVRMSWSEMTHPDDLAADLEQFNRVLSGQIEQYNMDKRFIRKDGKVIWTNLSVGCVRKPDGSVDHMIALVEDITSSKLAEEALRESEEKYRLVVENAAEIILVAQDGLLKYVNPMAVKILGYSEEVLTSMPFVELIHPEDVKKVFEAHMRIMRGEKNQPVHQFRVVPLDGAVRWADSRAVVISWEGKPATVNFITDITDRKRMEEEILALSITDQLTGLYNRRGFLSLAGQQLKLSERNKSGVLLFFADLDLLKWINDTLGHEEGDKALIEAATVFRETFRTSDIIARLGGDEYAVLAVNLTEANSKTASARLQQLIDIRNNLENRRYRLSISMGCAYYDPEKPCSIDELMARADKLMYEQKQNKQGLLMQMASISSSNP